MTLRRTLAAVLALTQLTTVSGTGVFSGVTEGFVPKASAEGFVSEDLGLDLYRKVDQWVGKLKDMMAEKRIPWNAKKLNAKIGKSCKASGGARVECLDSWKDFTLQELNAIEAGSALPIASHLSKTAVVDTDDLAKIAKEARKFVWTLKAEAGDQTQAFWRIGSMGLFTDGSLDNSSYDLMKDLENVHAVIFAKDIPYGGVPNDGARTVASFWMTPGFPSSSTYNGYPYYPDVTVNPPIYAGSFSGKLTSSWLTNDAACADGTEIKGLDQSLAFDIENQLAYGSNGQTSGTPDELALPAAPQSPATVAGGSKKDNKTSSFPCFSFFCIRVDFLMYESLLLGGGKTYSIESVLDENYKIVQKFAGTSFIQAGHTNNFFWPYWKNLKLPSLVHLGVVVQTMPPPILNLNPSQTPRGASKTSSDEKEFKEVTAGVFKDYGIRYDKQNVIDDPQTSQTIRNAEGLSTDEAAPKLGPTRVPGGNYAFSKEAAVRQSYSDSFSNDLQEFRWFTQTFVDSIMNVWSLSQKFYEVPKGR